MSATVMAFPAIRFTPADLARFRAVALPRLELGVWSRVQRVSSRLGDTLFIYGHGDPGPMLAFSRNPSGYWLHYPDRDGWCRIGFGASAGEPLAVWESRPPAANEAGGGP